MPECLVSRASTGRTKDSICHDLYALVPEQSYIQSGHAKMRLFKDLLLGAISPLQVNGFSKTHRIRKAEDFSYILVVEFSKKK